MEKLKFNTVGQFLVALEEGPLYDEKGVKYVFNKNSVINGLTVDRGDKRKGPCRFTDLFSIDKIGLTHTFTRQKPIPDKALVWCWDNAWETRRDVRFYDNKNNHAFVTNGGRYGDKYDNYRVVEPNEQGLYEAPFEWANEAKKKLKD